PGQDTTVTTPAIPGASLLIKAGTLTDGQGQPYTGALGFTEVPPDRTPAPLPGTLHPDLVVTVQPGRVVYTHPAPLTLPNRAGLPANQTLNLWELDPATGLYTVVGAARVSADGTTIATTSGGVRDGSLYFFLPQAVPVNDPAVDVRNEKLGVQAVNQATAP